MLSLLLAVPSCTAVFGTVSSLHPTSFLMIFILVVGALWASGRDPADASADAGERATPYLQR